MDRIKNFIKKGNLGSSEESKTRKRVDEYERTRKGIQQVNQEPDFYWSNEWIKSVSFIHPEKLSADTAKLGLENQGLSKEITARTDYRKRVVLPCLVLEKTRLARLDGKSERMHASCCLEWERDGEGKTAR